MKKTFQYIAIALLGAGLVACESMKLGDAGLSKAPETSGATIDTLFASLKDADKVLASAYYYLPYGLVSDFDSKMGGDFLESRFGSEKDYKAIYYAWSFLENAGRIPNADPAELAKKKAEAKVCMAIAYSNMLRFVGGVPIIDHAIDPAEEMTYPRNTFAETVDFIVKLCDEAAPDLPWAVSAAEDGRMTRAGALGLKLRVLCFAASPTFNSNTKWHPQADEYTCYGNYDPARWQAAKAAADEFMRQQLANGHYALCEAQPDPVTGLISPRAYRLAYRKGYFERGSSESIISIRKSNSTSYHDKHFEVQGSYGSIRKSNSTSYHDKHFEVQGSYGSGATLDWVNKFPWANGEPFPDDFPWEDKASWPEHPFFKPDPLGTLKVNGATFSETRDPRLYENIGVPGDIWRDGSVGRGYDNHKYHQDGCTGFLMMKFVLQQNTDRSQPPHWPFMRFAEVLLNCAEAYNEADGGPSDKAYAWVNAVRARVGLPGLPEGLSQEEFRKALILERELEFGFEEVRWFDMVRWGLTEAFTTPLRGLTSFGDNNNAATVFTFKEKEAYPPRKWYTSWDTKWYLAPIPALEINKGYGMTQNPGW